MIKSAVNRMNASVVQRAGVSGTCREGEQPLKTIISHQPLIRIGMKRIKSQSKFQESFYFKKGIHCFPRQCSHVTSPANCCFLVKFLQVLQDRLLHHIEIKGTGPKEANLLGLFYYWGEGGDAKGPIGFFYKSCFCRSFQYDFGTPKHA